MVIRPSVSAATGASTTVVSNVPIWPGAPFVLTTDLPIELLPASTSMVMWLSKATPCPLTTTLSPTTALAAGSLIARVFPVPGTGVSTIATSVAGKVLLLPAVGVLRASGASLPTPMVQPATTATIDSVSTSIMMFWIDFLAILHCCPSIGWSRCG